MKNININFIVESDKKIIAEGVPLYKRPIFVAIDLCEKNGIKIDFLDPYFFQIYVEPIHEFYKKIYPNGVFSFPPVIVGAVVLRGTAYTVNIPIMYGELSINLIDSIDISSSELKLIYNLYPEDFWQAHYSICDLYDFGYGANDLISRNSSSLTFLELALEQNSATASILVNNAFIEPVVQTTLLTAELALKATLIELGYTEQEYKKIGHNHKKLMSLLSLRLPKDNDELLLKICSTFPNYVNSRYQGSGLNKIELSKIAMSAQFIAAECMRRISDRNMLKGLENTFDQPRTYYF